ncbi:TIGR03862 family flavoprotein [Methylomarinum sp. Ch1-1]|uniref:TIGR03862 family flavoprotein n=1 Tax=Methylomarinum roseum TaxID=3067653 RepID=A0AAU7NX29_9GAMM
MTVSTKSDAVRSVAVIGGGPAGLMAAEVLSRKGVRVDLYDAMPSLGRKFLMAGKGGMNISHSEGFDRFISRYGERREQIEPLLRAFSPEDLRDWVHGLGINTFVGSSGRVFPTEMKAAPLLRAWLHRLREAGVRFHVRRRWLDWSEVDGGKRLTFAAPDGEKALTVDAVVLALGGGSWAKLGSTGAWAPLLRRKQIAVEALQPSNCGFDIGWSEHFREVYAGQPVKNVTATFTDADGQSLRVSGEFNVTVNGVEGSLIYALSGPIRNSIAVAGQAGLVVDLLPSLSLAAVVKKLSRPRGKNSFANHLRKTVGLKGVKAGLLREQGTVEILAGPERLAALIKALPLTLASPRPIDEAISTAGGVAFAALDSKLMIRACPGVFCAGEMLDWEAPTGGYLLTACLASGFVAGQGAAAWLDDIARVPSLKST